MAAVYNFTIIEPAEKLFVSFVDTLSILPHLPYTSTIPLLQENDMLSPILTPFTTVYTGSVQVILGMQALYAMEMLEGVLNAAFPSIEISRWIVLDASTLSTDWNSGSSSDSSSYNTDISMQVVNKQHEVLHILSSAEIAALRSERTLLLLSVLDCAELHLHNPEASKQLQWTEKSEFLLNKSMQVIAATAVVLLSGEVIDLSTVGSLASKPPDLILVATMEPSLLPKYTSSVLYMPVFATAFFELQSSLRDQNNNNHPRQHTTTATTTTTTTSSSTSEHNTYSPISLLRPSSPVSTISTSTIETTHTHPHNNDATATAHTSSIKTRGVAYLYHRCDRTTREEFYTILKEKIKNNNDNNKRKNDYLSIDALGKCDGTENINERNHEINKEKTLKNNDNKRKKSTRFTRNYLYEAILLYKSYQFTIAFENSNNIGYITEKLINSYLSHTIPIYYGATDVNKYFHNNSMINCNNYINLSACADRVISVSTNITLYNSIKTTIPIINIDIWTELFPWENIRNNNNNKRKKEWKLKMQKYLNKLVN